VRVCVLGAGGWGTAFARLLARAGHETILWARNPDTARALDRVRENRTYLPRVRLPREGLAITSDLALAMACETVVLAVPSFAVADLVEQIVPLSNTGKVFISLTKGLDRVSRRTVSQVIAATLPHRAIYALSGPSHAEEVGRDRPTAVVLAGSDLDLGRTLQVAMATSRFRIYLTDDIRGVELCAALKNIIALASGVSDGLGFGDNSRGALITRGLAEMVRFGRHLGVRSETLFGLSGLGDLVATCTSEHSRNRRVGVRLGHGERLQEILSGMRMVAEGVYATQIVAEMAREQGVEMPITDAVWRLLDGAVAPAALVDEIMTREPKREGE
jgi:glycerol-3-phosphate dehydrogenase (NAD(P)+)